MADIFGDIPVARIELRLDDAQQPFRIVVPPETIELDTANLSDGAHVLHLAAYDSAGNVGRRDIPFMVQNGPGITVTGLRPGERIGGTISLDINAFGGNEPFDPVRAESSGPIPVWTWVMIAVFCGWALWYGLAAFGTPALYAQSPTYAENPVASAEQTMTERKPPTYSGRGVAAGFDYASTGPQRYAQYCAACHGTTGLGVPGTFPALAADPVVTAQDPTLHVRIVLRGLHARPIKGVSYTSEMPAFAQLSDQDIAAIIDHERTSWGNSAPIIAPDIVKRAR
jgi:mono/diheme cytochrome c family protein